MVGLTEAKRELILVHELAILLGTLGPHCDGCALSNSMLKLRGHDGCCACSNDETFFILPGGSHGGEGEDYVRVCYHSLSRFEFLITRFIVPI